MSRPPNEEGRGTDAEGVIAGVEKRAELAEEHDLACWNADAVKAGNLAP